MKVRKLEAAIEELYKFLELRNFDPRKAILVGTSVGVLYKKLKETEDIDILVLSVSSFKSLRKLVNPVKTYRYQITFERNGVKFSAGLPKAYGLVRPYNAYEKMEFDGVSIPVRPLTLIEKDWRSSISNLEKIAKDFDYPKDFLPKYGPYVKYSRRLEQLSHRN